MIVRRGLHSLVYSVFSGGGGWRDAFMSLTEMLFTSEMVLRSGGGAGQTICLKFVV